LACFLPSFARNTPIMRILISFFSFFVLTCLSAQINIPSFNSTEEYNFIPDPSFEMVKDIPCGWNQGIGKFDTWMQYWTSPTQTTPDLLSNKASSTCWSNPSKHSDGKQRPKEGDNMIGIKVFGTGGTETYWHEYIQVELKEPLKADSLYFLSFYANLSSRASKSCNNIGALVSHEAIMTRDRFPLYITPTINSQKVIKQSILGWKQIDGVFKAEGGEQFLIIGNFYRDESTIMDRLDQGKDGAYYYVDDVMLRRAHANEKESAKPPYSAPSERLVQLVKERGTTAEFALPEVKYEVGTTIELSNIFFDFDTSELLPDSQKELNKLVDLMTDYPLMHIELSGHTDDQGSANYNQKLSQERAQSVVAYLIHKDVEQERLNYQGYGSSLPIADNSTELGRKQNRRVEFKVLKN